MEEYTNYLAHHGIKGMKWGIRRYQNEDGSLTDSGRKHYGVKSKRKEKIKKGLKIAGAGAAVAGAAAGATVAVKRGRSSDKTKKPSKEHPMFERSIKRGKDKEKYSPAEQITKEAGNVIDNTGNAYSKARRAYKRAEIDLERQKYEKKVKSMSDAELQSKIRRLELEKRYINLSSPSYDVGKDRVEDVLDVLGPVASIAGSAAIVGTTLWKLKNKS